MKRPVILIVLLLFCCILMIGCNQFNEAEIIFDASLNDIDNEFIVTTSITEEISEITKAMISEKYTVEPSEVKSERRENTGKIASSIHTFIPSEATDTASEIE